MAKLTEAERDSLTECECGHYLNEHSSEGCLATVYDDRLDDMCPCMATPDFIRERAIVAMIVARVDAVLAKFEALHKPWMVCDDCNHEHTDKEVREGLAFDTGYSYTCTDAALYIACSECCVADDEQTQECADWHIHTLNSDDRCATARLIKEARNG